MFGSMSEKQRIVAMALTAAGVQGLIAFVTNSFRVFFGAFGPYSVTGMVDIYFKYSSQALNGQVPYRDYLIEYPILGFVFFLIPRLFVSDWAGYRIAFSVQLLLFNAAAVYIVAHRVGQEEGVDRVPGRLVWYTVFFASLCPLLMGPYDLAPMAVAFAAASFWFNGRNALGGVLAGLGVLLKIFPGAVAAPAVVWEAMGSPKSHARGTCAFLATIAAGMSFWLWLGGTGVARSFSYHADRGLGVESLYAGVLLLIGKASGQRVPWTYDHSAIHISPEWGDRLAGLALPLQIAAFILIMWRFRRSGMKAGVRYAGASVVAFMVTGKILSPQFLIWMIPFATVIGGATGRSVRWIFLLACIATTLIYPLIALKLIVDDNNLGGIILLNYRNALLLGLLYLLLFGKETEAAPLIRHALESSPLEKQAPGLAGPGTPE